MLNYYKNIGLNFGSLIPYIIEFNLLNFYSTLRGHPLRDESKHKKLKPKMKKLIEKGLLEDARLCTELGIEQNLPTTKELIKHFKSLANVYKDYQSILEKRDSKKIKLPAKKDYPEYYTRNYHFQTDGYTSEHSASIYDHQVDILFAGMAVPMRRTILEEFKTTKPRRVLELACGTGSATEIVANHLKNSQIIATDLSHEYIQFAQKKRKLPHVEFKQMNASEIAGEWDCIYHVFLLHELPPKEREDILRKQLKHLSQNGKGILVESLQVGDIDFFDEVLYDFPKYYHEPFYKSYIETPIEKQLEQLGARNIKVTSRLFSKCVSFTK